MSRATDSALQPYATGDSLTTVWSGTGMYGSSPDNTQTFTASVTTQKHWRRMWCCCTWSNMLQTSFTHHSRQSGM